MAKWKAIRFISDYPIYDVEEATKAMKTAGAFDAPGVGSWKIEQIGDYISYLFFPGMSTKLALTKQEYMWMKIGQKATKMWEKKLPGHKFKYVLDADAKLPEGKFARFRKHAREAMMLKEFFKKVDKKKLDDLKRQTKELADEAKRV